MRLTRFSFSVEGLEQGNRPIKRFATLALPLIALCAAGCDDPSENSFKHTNSFVSAYSAPFTDTGGASATDPGNGSSYFLNAENGTEGKFDRMQVVGDSYSSEIVSRISNGDGTVTATDDNGREYTMDENSMPENSENGDR